MVAVSCNRIHLGDIYKGPDGVRDEVVIKVRFLLHHSLDLELCQCVLDALGHSI